MDHRQVVLQCHKIHFGYKFTAVCGQAKGYQYGSPDKFNNGQNIDRAYIDGLYITYGRYSTYVQLVICLWSGTARWICSY